VTPLRSWCVPTVVVKRRAQGAAACAARRPIAARTASGGTGPAIGPTAPPSSSGQFLPRYQYTFHRKRILGNIGMPLSPAIVAYTSCSFHVFTLASLYNKSLYLMERSWSFLFFISVNMRIFRMFCTVFL
jgi:hypothetical protein